ncbi:MAG: FemAB family PEP-CTERM system-associated protein [candidate division KSB1 bacterium]|nr:FemAB family PEP-CTERM system-associated protein [candidate division KSB1 bacterium]MDZ7302293.1 FemAB family PEP-CTERM system-associated protein [candidate division KSB1 bacterium]MDZ7311399.1 FemAB family PEP-CTERM system-associated protein [candidate division KSB1 bacterium]
MSRLARLQLIVTDDGRVRCDERMAWLRKISYLVEGMKITTLESETKLWDDFVHGQATARGPHLSGWKRVIEETFGHTCIYLMASGNGQVRGVLPLVHMRSRLFGSFLVSIPFLNYGGIVSEDPIVRKNLFDFACALAAERRAEYVELRHESPLLENLPTKQHKVAMLLDLPDKSEGLWNRFKPKLRSQIRKPMKEGLVARIGREEELGNFYEVFTANMRDLGTPVYSKNFFATILKHFPDSSWIASVSLNKRPLAAGFLFGFRDTLEIPWASSLRRYNHLAANMLLYWSVLEFAIQQGYQRFDFGRSSPGEGTYKFKEQWGAQPVPLHWQYWLGNGTQLPNLSPTNSKYHLAISVWQKLPLFLTRWIGPAIVRHIP